MAINDHKSKTKRAKKSQKENNHKDENCIIPKEVGGREGPDPTRFGDWEKNGRCIDF